MANEVLIPVKYVVDDADLTRAGQKLGALSKEEQKLEAEMNDVAAAARRQTTAFNQAGDAGTKAAKDTEKQYNMLGNTVKNLGEMIAGAFAVDRLLSLGKAVVDITAEFQKFSAVLTTSLGSGSEAERAMLMIQNFAAKTPFSVAELTDSFVKFANRGIKLTAKEMEALGDLASSTGKSFDQLTEAALDAMTGENERLKEFGIQATKTGETTQYTFKGVTTEVQNTDAAVRAYLISLGQVEGVTGSMAAISETLTGKISNLGDSFDQLLLTLGNQTTGVMGGTIALINEMVTSLTKLLTTTEELGKQQAAGAVSEYSTKVSAEFKKVADAAKKSGENVQDALDWKAAGLEAGLNKELEEATKRLQAFQDERGKIGNKVTELIDFSGNTILTNKSLEATFASEVERIKGQLESLQEAKKSAIAPDPAADKAAKDAAEKAAKAAEDAFKKRDKSRVTYQAISTEALDQFTKDATDAQDKERKAFEKNKDAQLRKATETAKAETEANEEASKKRIADYEKEQARKEQIQQQSVELFVTAGNLFLQYQSEQLKVQSENLDAYYQQELAATGDNAAARARVEAEYQKKQRELKTKEAQNEKAQALFNIAVQGAENVVKAFEGGPVLMALAASIAAIQAAFVAARPIPKFAKGTRNVTGGTPGEDSVLSLLMPGERVVTTDKNRKLGPAFDVLTDSKRSPQFWNQVMAEIDKFGTFTPPNLKQIAAAGSGSSLDTDRIVAAVRGIVVERTIFDEQGVTRYTERELSRIRKLNKRYGF